MDENRIPDIVSDGVTGADEFSNEEDSSGVIFMDEVIFLELGARTSGDGVAVGFVDNGDDDVIIDDVIILDALTAGDETAKYKNIG